RHGRGLPRAELQHDVQAVRVGDGERPHGQRGGLRRRRRRRLLRRHHHGRAGKTGATLIPAQTGVAFGDDFGNSIAGVGDADGDGWDDVLVGAPFGDVPAEDAGGARLIGWQVVQPDVGGGGVGSTQLTVFGPLLASGYAAELLVTGAPA